MPPVIRTSQKVNVKSKLMMVPCQQSYSAVFHVQLHMSKRKLTARNIPADIVIWSNCDDDAYTASAAPYVMMKQ